ncbi:hypothetical protein PAEPH01_2630, partial [Pancytospora epiphaga]
PPQEVQKGKYKIHQLLDVSHSLMSQLDGIDSFDPNNIYKAVISKKESHTQSVIYILGPIRFGAGSTIEIIRRLALPIVTGRDFIVCQSTTMHTNIEFINRLMGN